MTSSHQSTKLSEWVNTLLIKVLFQPDDEVASDAFKQSFSPDFQVIINGKTHPLTEYRDLIMGGRAKVHISLQSIDELVYKTTDDEGKIGSVAHHTKFMLKNKESGEERHREVVFLSTVILRDGEPMLSQLQEVSNI